MNDDSLTPAELIRSYGNLREAVTPLATLAKVSPSILEEVIALAMTMGIHAAERRAKEDKKIELACGLLDRATASFWSGEYK